jgi:hypothetical protein
MIVRG